MKKQRPGESGKSVSPFASNPPQSQITGVKSQQNILSNYTQSSSAASNIRVDLQRTLKD